MASTNGQSAGNGTKWEGYSNYQEVSKRVSKSVSDAIDAYTILQSAHGEGATIDPETAANARADIMAAAMRLLVEMREEQDRGVEDYDDILERWTQPDDTEDRKGYLQEMHDVRLRDQMPGWMFQFVLDIRQVGWSLGYLQAGRRSKQEPDDPVEADVQAMFEGL